MTLNTSRRGFLKSAAAAGAVLFVGATAKGAMAAGQSADAMLATLAEALQCGYARSNFENGEYPFDVGAYVAATKPTDGHGFITTIAIIITIIATIDLLLDGGSTLPWKICSPFALMWYLASLSFAFSCLLEKTLSNVTSNIALWGDEGTGGNPLRPDEHNKFLMLYMTFHEWPSYWRSLGEGWLPLGCISYAMLHRVKSKYSGVLRALLMYMLKGWIGLGPPTSLSQRFGPSRRRSLL